LVHYLPGQDAVKSQDVVVRKSFLERALFDIAQPSQIIDYFALGACTGLNEVAALL
jgi:hypothetical protein